MPTALIVDDSKLARMVVVRTLKALQPDWDRAEAGNGEEALAVVAAREVDIALLDYNMPGMNGLELAAALRALHPTMPIAIVTANVQDEVIEQVRTLQATFVLKPVNEDSLRGFVSGAALRLRRDPA